MEFAIFALVAIIAVLAALGLLLSRNAIYAAMFLILNMVSLAVIYLLLNAPFIAAVQIAVYAGAIMVLFIFVIMLLGAEKINSAEVRPEMRWQRPVAGALALALGALALFTLFSRGLPPPSTVVDASPMAIGKSLFSVYLFPFEVASILLLAAMVGAVVLTKKD